AGWRGTVADKAGVAVQAFTELNPSAEPNASQLEAVIGPSIGPCCYEVDETVIEPASRFLAADAEGAKLAEELKRTRRFDLWSVNEWALRRAGVEHITRTDLCTACHTDCFFSNRAEGGIKGEFAGLIGLT
ncbi:MAG TPA: laccase domain-containing protein, partial [Candidatus Saccharimonadales bacterium]|nr:laccase domain-containing protein [Candidatus Saccharimonadales bacterium]